jgi:hypothetical protein
MKMGMAEPTGITHNRERRTDMALVATKKLALVKEYKTVLLSPRLRLMYGSCGAVLLQQVHFWCTTHPNRREGRDWCYKTYEAWAKEMQYSVRQVKYAVKALVEAGVIVTGRFNKMGYDRTLWYRIEYSVLKQCVALPIVQLLHDQKCSNCTINSAETALTIPESISESISESSSASAKAKTEVQPVKKQQEQKQEPKEVMTLKTLPTFEKGKVTLFKKGRVSSKPVEDGMGMCMGIGMDVDTDNLALKVGLGEISMATAKEILAAQNLGHAKAHRLPMLWQKEKASLKGSFQKPLTAKEMAQLKKFGKDTGDLAEKVLLYATSHWQKYAVEVKSAAGLTTVPMEPDIGFLLKYSEIATNQYLKSVGEHVTMQSIALCPSTPSVPIHIPIPIHTPTQEAYKPSQAEIDALLASL